MIRILSIRCIVAAMLFICASPVQLLAADNKLSESLATSDLQDLSQSIDKLAEVLRKSAGDESRDTSLRRLEIAIAYLNFRSRRIEMFERDLQALRTNRNRMEDVMEQFQREEENLSGSFDNNQQEALQRAREEMSFRRQVVKDRISRMDEEIIILENRIMDMQSQIDSVESFVEKNLVF